MILVFGRVIIYVSNQCPMRAKDSNRLTNHLNGKLFYLFALFKIYLTSLFVRVIMIMKNNLPFGMYWLISTRSPFLFLSIVVKLKISFFRFVSEYQENFVSSLITTPYTEGWRQSRRTYLWQDDRSIAVGTMSTLNSDGKDESLGRRLFSWNCWLKVAEHFKRFYEKVDI